MTEQECISYGSNITAAADRLGQVPIERFYQSLRSPKADIEARIRNLRIIYSVDVKRYRDMKRQLPYIVCAAFNPPHRRTDHFALTRHFIVDIDHVAQKGLDMTVLRQRIETDPQVLLTFVSPSQDGLKVMFRLAEPCYDSGLYSLFYKVFVERFSQQYQLEQVADRSTSDVCRACFVSVDPEAYYNPEALPVRMDAYIELDNPQVLFEQKAETEKKEKERRAEAERQKDDTPKDPAADTILKIRESLGLKPLRPEKVPPHVPEQLNAIIDELKEYIERAGIQVREIINISFGKKLRMVLGINQAELNVFYGKRGYSVVQSPRTGTNPDLNQLCADIVNAFFDEKQDIHALKET